MAEHVVSDCLSLPYGHINAYGVAGSSALAVNGRPVELDLLCLNLGSATDICIYPHNSLEIAYTVFVRACDGVPCRSCK